MDIDPLQDTHAPRYAVESDDSDDEGNSVTRTSAPVHEPVISINWPGKTGLPLVVAIGGAGSDWQGGLDLGEAESHVQIDDISVADIYVFPTAVIALVSYRLPISIVRAIAASLLATLAPKSVVILDTYAVPAYISSAPLSTINPPTLQLASTSTFRKLTIPPSIFPFATPNLLQSLPAALLSLIEQQSKFPGLLILLPSRTIPPPPPRRQPEPYPSTAREGWSVTQLSIANDAIRSVSGDLKWDQKKLGVDSSTAGAHVRYGRRGDIGDGGMYI